MMALNQVRVESGHPGAFQPFCDLALLISSRLDNNIELKESNTHTQCRTVSNFFSSLLLDAYKSLFNMTLV